MSNQNNTNNIKKHYISELKNFFKDVPGFVVGNGVSKTFYNIDRLSKHGVIFGCNRAYEYHHVDFLGIMDVFKKAVGYTCVGNCKAIKFICDTSYGKDYTDFLNKYNDEIYYYVNGRSYKHPDMVEMGSSGSLILQAAYKLGCNPIILIGCDCCYINNSEHAIEDKKKRATRMYNGYVTNNSLISFYKTFMRLYKTMSKERKIYKLGNHGMLDIPTITPEILYANKYE